VLLLFRVDGKLTGKMSCECVIDLERLVEKDVIPHVVVMFIVCYIFYPGRYARDKCVLCV
jgi:hypothetical protein